MYYKSNLNVRSVEQLIKDKTTPNGGYKDLAWEIMSTFPILFGMGGTYLEHVNCDVEPLK